MNNLSLTQCYLPQFVTPGIVNITLNKYLFQLKQLFIYFDPYLGFYPNKIILTMTKTKIIAKDVPHMIMYDVKILEII